MLELLILKVIHSKPEEAQKLVPYIAQCDIFGPEAKAFGSEEDAVFQEHGWETMIDSKIKRDKFKKDNDQALRQSLRQNPPDESYAYHLISQKALATHSRKIWIAERFSFVETMRGNEAYRTTKKAYEVGVHALALGDVAGSLEWFRTYFTEMQRLGELRDQHIGKNLDSTEQYLRNRYPQFQHKEPLRLMLFYGGMHNPELYCKVPYKVVEIGDLNEYKLVEKDIKRLRKNEITPEENKLLLLQAAVWNIIEKDLKSIRQMSYPELCDYAIAEARKQ